MMAIKSKKYIVFDAGPIISLAMNGMLYVIEKLKENFNGDFIITAQVKKEVVERPLKIKKYELEGVRVKDLIDRGIISLSSKFVSDSLLNNETKKIMKSANSSFKDKRTGERINLIHEGEASILAFSNLCKCENLIVIDERTARMLIESPDKLKNLMEKKLHTSIEYNEEKLKSLKDLKFIRSSELLYVAYKKDLLGLKKDKTLLEAVLYGVKYRGTAISSREIERMKKLI